jgi:hypothetical protein
MTTRRNVYVLLADLQVSFNISVNSTVRYATKLYIASRLHWCPFYLVPESDMYRTESLRPPEDSVSANILGAKIKGTLLISHYTEVQAGINSPNFYRSLLYQKGRQ